jgi:hypothetical protein
MGMRKLGDTITFDFTTHNPSTGMVQDADLLPTCEVFGDENDVAILTPVVVKRSGKTGDYRVSIEATVGNGFEVGPTYNVICSVTVNLVSAKARVGVFVLDSKRNADMNDLSTLQVRNEVDSEFAERGYSAERAGLLDNLDVEVSTRALETGGKIDNIKTETDKIQPEIINKKDEYKADVSSLALEASVQGVSSDVAALTQDIADLTDIVILLKAFVTNKKYLSKVGSTWYLVIKNSLETADILNKALKDKYGNDITDLQAGTLAQEMASIV